MLLTQILLAGTFAARPTASTLPNGTLYAATDTGVIYQVQSAAWATWYPAPSGSGTVTSVATGTGLTGGPITSTGTIDLDDTAVSPGTYGDASNVAQITVDQQGRITAASEVAITGGGGGGLILIENKQFTANATSYDFTGLDGDTDGIYLLLLRVKNASGTGTAISVQPNAISTNQNTSAWANTTSGGNPFGVSYLLALGTFDTATIAQGRMELFARKVQNSVALNRGTVGQYGNKNGGQLIQVNYIGEWNETSTNITSLRVIADQTNGIGNGSEIALYKYQQ